MRYVQIIALIGCAALVSLAVLGNWLSRDAQPDAELQPLTHPPGPIAVDAEFVGGGGLRFVGRNTCARCHQAEVEAWTGSHHDWAMKVPTEATVLGDFDDTTFTHLGVNHRFYRQDGGFYIRTQGPGGAMHDYKVAYTFGVEPLQQYLIEVPGGRLQVLPLCWDSRPEDEGGQRWFHLHGDQWIPPHDELFWTHPAQNWNMQCAECHSTNLQKHYDAGLDEYATTFSEINVSCEACHGPGSKHVAWAERTTDQRSSAKQKGLTIDLSVEPYSWIINPKTNLPERSRPLESHAELQACARCHSRREQLNESFAAGDMFLDAHKPMLLEQPQYEVDGQIDGEVYVYGSFTQSRMHAHGVSCRDCHKPHGLELTLPEPQLCMKCHQPQAYDTPEHHFHSPGEAGSNCVDCHMPHQTYMAIDQRRDHSFRVPRPDRSLALGTPNACNQCHTDRSIEWAAARFTEMWGEPEKDRFGFAHALHAAISGEPMAADQLIKAARNETYSPIARATTLARLEGYPSREALALIQQMIGHAAPLIRLAAVRALSLYPSQIQWQVGGAALNDEAGAVRIEAARVLAAASTDPAMDSIDDHSSALKELLAAHALNADRPGTLVSHGNLQLALGTPGRAESAYRRAIRREPQYVPAYVNLADLYRQQGDETAARQTLREGLNQAPGAAALHHALGLALVRQRKMEPALQTLGRAVKLAPERAHYRYVHAVALHSVGKGDEAMAVLQAALENHPRNAALLQAMATIARNSGWPERARRAARRLIELAPHEPAYRQLLESIPARSRAGEHRR